MIRHVVGHKNAKVGHFVILAQKVKVGENYSLNFLILRLLTMLQILECTLNMTI